MGVIQEMYEEAARKNAAHILAEDLRTGERCRVVKWGPTMMQGVGGEEVTILRLDSGDIDRGQEALVEDDNRVIYRVSITDLFAL